MTLMQHVLSLVNKADSHDEPALCDLFDLHRVTASDCQTVRICQASRVLKICACGSYTASCFAASHLLSSYLVRVAVIKLVVHQCAGQKGPQAAKQQRRNEAKEKRRLQAAGKGDGSQSAKHKNTFMEVIFVSYRMPLGAGMARVAQVP